MAGYGKHAENALQRVVHEEKGKYLAVVEGSIPTADDGVHCTIGGRTALDIAHEVCTNALVTLAVGACAWDGGLVRSNPNPTGAVGVQEAVPGIKPSRACAASPTSFSFKIERFFCDVMTP